MSIKSVTLTGRESDGVSASSSLVLVESELTVIDLVVDDDPYPVLLCLVFCDLLPRKLVDRVLLVWVLLESVSRSAVEVDRGLREKENALGESKQTWKVSRALQSIAELRKAYDWKSESCSTKEDAGAGGARSERDVG